MEKERREELLKIRNELETLIHIMEKDHAKRIEMCKTILKDDLIIFDQDKKV